MERLAAAGFALLPAFEIFTHFVVERDGFVALVERLPDGGFGAAGAPALLRNGAFTVLVWKSGRPVLVSKGREEPAGADLVDGLRRFDTELRQALGSGAEPA
jgi:hypothetical protein